MHDERFKLEPKAGVVGRPLRECLQSFMELAEVQLLVTVEQKAAASLGCCIFNGLLNQRYPTRAGGGGVVVGVRIQQSDQFLNRLVDAALSTQICPAETLLLVELKLLQLLLTDVIHSIGVATRKAAPGRWARLCSLQLKCVPRFGMGRTC